MSQKAELLCALRDGEKLTPLNALIRYHTLALSQRMGELRRDGWAIKSEMIKVGEKHVAQYSMEA